MFAGDVLNVISDMDSSGCYTAEYKGQRGLVPAAFIQAMDISDSETQKRLLDQVHNLIQKFTT